MATHILGIRHHGPGSARNVQQFLEQLKPDIVLVEGPPDADGILQWANHAEMQPPVAILAYQTDNIRRSVFYPFSEFSPEWQAIQYARRNNIHVRFMDLPLAHRFALDEEQEAAAKAAAEKEGKEKESALLPDNDADATTVAGINNAGEETDVAAPATTLTEDEYHGDSLSWLARAAGYANTDKWWEHMFEHRLANEQVFEAVHEAMKALRDTLPERNDQEEKLREAYMRKVIRQAEKEMFPEIAVICGAWHAPALKDMPSQKADNELLKGLPKVKVECTWTPWNYNRLSYFSGYGAGIQSPGWYEHIWHHPNDDGTRWMAGVAKLFRQQNIDTSVAHVIEAVRLAESLASLRDLPKAGLEELNEATLSVLCNGESILLRLIEEQLIVSNKMGNVPADTPKPPLQVDIEKLQKRLRLPATAEWKDYTLDLRKENDLERSIFLHRLQLLGLKWGHKSEVSGKGTFKEQWRLQWDPGFTIDIIEKGTWGNTAAEAAAKYVIHQARETDSLQIVGRLLEATMPAELPQAVEVLIHQLNNLSAASGDVIQLMEVIPSLVSISRYGNVRKTDAALVTEIVTGMIARICISLPNACTAVADDAAAALLELFFKMNDAINLLQQPDITTQWQQMLRAIAGSTQTSPVISGYSTRLLADYKLLEGEELVKVFWYAMSNATAPGMAAAWLEGFLKGSGTLLLVDNNLWGVIDGWVNQLDGDTFTEVLPLLRRTFANFTAAERRKLGEKVKQGDGGSAVTIQQANDSFNAARAQQSLPVVMQLLGYPS
ncbi:hypothetical protein F0L74_17600 [Chitinophaga agrisoli]|uniref:Uncharacterized protein n=1 Tax=Chitinophaga agrisoli TaxID=2607653 RepID=A0A5B2VSR5_9BACT|nr:DUF5682 family protein [Chitinophaga agrisoli]KAA2241690.1 hypothetical protein F0L74_17600 [Chitinophaga agrisoli]